MFRVCKKLNAKGTKAKPKFKVKMLNLVNNETLIININSKDIETTTLLQTSGLLALFENMKFTVEISTKNNINAKIRLISNLEASKICEFEIMMAPKCC